MNKIFYTEIFEQVQDDQSQDQDVNDQSETQDDQSQVQDDQSQGQEIDQPEDIITKFQKYILFIKLKDLQYRMSLVQSENLEFIESLKLLNLILDSFDLFKYDQAFTLSNFLIDKISKYKLEKIKK